MTEERDLVNSIKQDFLKAMKSLNVREIGRYGEDETEMLDFAILIALHWKELSLIAKYGGSGDIMETQKVTRRASSEAENLNIEIEDDWRDYDENLEGKIIT